MRHPPMILPIVLASAVPLLAGVVSLEEQSSPPAPVAVMSREDKIRSWKGEKVALLPSPFLYDLFEKPGGNSSFNNFIGYYGKTGVIEDVDPQSGRLVIVMNGTGEKLSAKSEIGLGFVAEREMAERFAGQTWWSRGVHDLFDPPNPPNQKLSPPVDLAPASKITVGHAEWGGFEHPILLRVRTEDGLEYVYPLHFSDNCLDSRFRVSKMSERRCDQRWSPEKDFFLTDPGKAFPKWSKEIWALVRSGKVAIGMTEDMVNATCGTRLRDRGAVITSAGKVSHISRCNGTEFVMEDGKVTKYVPD